jgi:hypothetical protein
MPVLEERYVFSGGRDSVKLQGVAAAIKLLRKRIAA